jgi:hypothetical protein
MRQYAEYMQNILSGTNQQTHSLDVCAAYNSGESMVFGPTF